MRKSFLFAAMASIVVSTASIAQDNEKSEKMVGSGNVITKDVAVKSFDAINVSGVFNVILTQGNTEAVKIEAEDNLQELFEVKNEGSKLVISTRKHTNINTKKMMKVYITFRKIKEMQLRTVGGLSSTTDLSFDDLKIDNQSVGSIDMKLNAKSVHINNQSVGGVKLVGKADDVTIRNEGVGSIMAASFVTQKMDIENTGVGSAVVNAEKELKVKDSFLGKVTNTGGASVKKKVVI